FCPILNNSVFVASMTFFIADLIESGSSGLHKKPLTFSIISLGKSETLEQIMGLPNAIASHIAFGNPSYKLNNPTTSAFFIISLMDKVLGFNRNTSDNLAAEIKLFALIKDSSVSIPPYQVNSNLFLSLTDKRLSALITPTIFFCGSCRAATTIFIFKFCLGCSIFSSNNLLSTKL